ncbi:hypothetical protein [Clostridium intestinale]|uniref:hypothetical protein n=1 Tax=Clostridium intestinale TaxID=36845 RepID=UPI0028EE7701|nr:hypothetical protein [Clostridium intestinale]
MNIYKLYPPFLYVPEEYNFYDQWEVFCLSLLKLENKTNDIERLKAPEGGVDLYYAKNNTAYQCKSCIEGSEVNLTKITNSLKNALKVKEILGWKKYVVCSNKNLTINQIEKIKKIYNDVEVKGEDYWIELCKKYPQYVKQYFRIVIELNKPIYNYRNDINFNRIYNKIDGKLNRSKNNDYINFNCEIHKKFYRIPISLKLSISEFMFMLRNIMDLDDVYKETCGNFVVQEKIIFNNEEFYYNPNDYRSLEEIGLKNEEIVFYQINVKNKNLNFDEDGMQLLLDESYLNEDSIKERILNEFEKKISKIHKDQYI